LAHGAAPEPPSHTCAAQFAANRRRGDGGGCGPGGPGGAWPGQSRSPERTTPPGRRLAAGIPRRSVDPAACAGTFVPQLDPAPPTGPACQAVPARPGLRVTRPVDSEPLNTPGPVNFARSRTPGGFGRPRLALRWRQGRNRPLELKLELECGCVGSRID
jgi:hypothetical protein